MKRAKGKGGRSKLGRAFFGQTPKKPEPDDTPGRDTKPGVRMQSGFPPGAPKKKLSARAKKRVENYRL